MDVFSLFNAHCYAGVGRTAEDHGGESSPARAPPPHERDRGWDSQIDPVADAYDGRDEQPADWM